MMLRALWTGLISASISLTLTACASSGTTPTSDTPRTDDATEPSSVLPSFEALDINGVSFDLDDHLGKDVIMISFWATYCEPCKAEMPVLQELQNNYADQGFKLISVSLDGPETMAGVKPYIRKNRYNFQVIVDEDTAITQAYNPRGTAPYTLLIGRDAKVHKRIAGFQASEAPMIEAEVRRLLGLTVDP